MRTEPLPRPDDVRLSEILTALSYALDLAEGQPMGHSQRSCVIGMALAERAGLCGPEAADLYYALLLKDAGCSSNAARVHELFGSDDLASKRAFKTVDWSRIVHAARYAMSRVQPGSSWPGRVLGLAIRARDGHAVTRSIIEARCARGAEIVRGLGFEARAAEAVASLDEHWNGGGQPRGLQGSAIPVLSRIIGLAQTIEVFSAGQGTAAALRVIRDRRGRWFDPELADLALTLGDAIETSRNMDERSLQTAVEALAPEEPACGPRTIDDVARAFADIIDAKSPYTAQHSRRMTEFAAGIASALGWNDAECRDLRHAGLLHDIGKLSVPNSILDKPGRLTPAEWEVVRLHPYYTQRILERVRGFKDLARVASSHHERLDGRGYFRGLAGEQIPPGGRILAVADVYEALTADRPYRDGLPPDRTLEIMEADRGTGFDEGCLNGLRRALGRDLNMDRAA